MKFEQEEARRPRNVTLTWPALESAGLEPEPSLPPAYERTALYLLVRDPNGLYAFWNVSPDKLAQVQPNQTKVLRVYEVNQAQSNWIQLGVGEAHSWYFTETKPDTTYYAELGLLQPDGQFILLARSNQVHSPRNSFSELTDEEWLTIDELYGISVGLKELHGSEEVLQAARVHLEQQLGSESVSSFSSPWGAYSELPAEPKAQELWLETNTFLTVQGRVTPGALLSINDQSIRPDSTGQFSYSLPLLEGDLKMRVHAATPDLELHTEKLLEIKRQTR